MPLAFDGDAGLPDLPDAGGKSEAHALTQGLQRGQRVAGAKVGEDQASLWFHVEPPLISHPG